MKLLLRYVHTAIKIGTGIASNVQISFVFFQEVGFLFPTFWWTTLPRDSFGLNLHTVKSATVTKTRRCSSRRMPWNNWEHTCPSLSWDFIAVNKKDVQSTWLPLLTALVKLLYSISAVRRIPAPWAIAVTGMNIDRLTAVICYTF